MKGCISWSRKAPLKSILVVWGCLGRLFEEEGRRVIQMSLSVYNDSEFRFHASQDIEKPWQFAS